MRISPVKIRKDKKEGATMTEELKNHCQDLTQTLTIELPSQIFERVQRYAKENGMDVAGVLIEALDSFLRKTKEI
jgi:LDH2 family malate/lactate/ureidoglycolate dehydrogenase